VGWWEGSAEIEVMVAFRAFGGLDWTLSPRAGAEPSAKSSSGYSILPESHQKHSETKIWQADFTHLKINGWGWYDLSRTGMLSLIARFPLEKRAPPPP
jgi:hypothetical protein